jgi:hypothetical protein
MTPEEFAFWQRAYLAALQGIAADPGAADIRCDSFARTIAGLAIESYRTAKATVVQTTYVTGD